MWFRAIPLALLGLCAVSPAVAETIVHCSSREFRDNYCPATTRDGVRLARQVSRAPCDEGRTWGFDRRGIWVTGGCEGEFALGGERSGRRARTLARPGSELVVCESRDFRYRHCSVAGGGNVRLVRQISKSECRYGVTWGHESDGIWVDRGCGAEFAVR